jgi:hypothetical protein
MNPWLRVGLVFGLAIAAALFLKVLPPVIVLVFFIGGIAAVNLGLKRRVKSERAEFRSDAVGLKHERGDPFGLTGYPFALFSRCGEASVEDVRWGTWRGSEVKRFDLACTTRAGERARFACAIGPASPAVVPLIVEAERWGTLLGDAPFGTVEPAASDGERTYLVRCDDAAFARPLVGPAMVEWLEGQEDPWGFELHGSLALVYGPPSAGLEGPLERLHVFVERTTAVLAPSGTGEIASRRPDPPPSGGARLGEPSDPS